ncbi:hypothetical protein SDC9_176093 [bioreactor metagenome]|uniref:Uncharacterized protein n=1 Tax=bioreactor metagenome TaxID=1076179 RepID=A0A645GQZ3_9ZZZZ
MQLYGDIQQLVHLPAREKLAFIHQHTGKRAVLCNIILHGGV